MLRPPCFASCFCTYMFLAVFLRLSTRQTFKRISAKHVLTVKFWMACPETGRLEPEIVKENMSDEWEEIPDSRHKLTHTCTAEDIGRKIRVIIVPVAADGQVMR
jgi:hypothetical protein